MKLVSKVSMVFLSVALGLNAAACGGAKKKNHEEASPVNQPKPIVQNPLKDESVPQLIPLTVGQEASAEGDVLKDENGMFSLTRTFSFKLDRETSFQIRKSFGNGNCGNASASFIVMKGEEQIGDVSIDRKNEYNGVPVEKFAEPLAPGDYMLVAFITLEQECKDMMFYYDFFLEEAK